MKHDLVHKCPPCALCGGPKIDWRRVWARLDLWCELSSYVYPKSGPTMRRKIAALVRRELRHKEER